MKYSRILIKVSEFEGKLIFGIKLWKFWRGDLLWRLEVPGCSHIHDVIGDVHVYIHT